MGRGFVLAVLVGDRHPRVSSIKADYVVGYEKPKGLLEVALDREDEQPPWASPTPGELGRIPIRHHATSHLTDGGVSLSA